MFCIMVGFSYVSGSSAFLKQLSREEEAYYIEEFEKGSKEAENVLIERNLRLVAHIVKKYSTSGYDNEDLISIGTIGLIKGIKTFKSDKNIKLATYCARCIENEILMSIRATKKHKNTGSLDNTVGIDKDGNEVALMEKIKDNKVDVEKEVETKIQIDKLMSILENALTERELQIIKYRYGIGCDQLPQREIGELLNISRSFVSRIEKNALKKLNKYLV